jgi:hypothetical protein
MPSKFKDLLVDYINELTTLKKDLLDKAKTQDNDLSAEDFHMVMKAEDAITKLKELLV